MFVDDRKLNNLLPIEILNTKHSFTRVRIDPTISFQIFEKHFRNIEIELFKMHLNEKNYTRILLTFNNSKC